MFYSTRQFLFAGAKFRNAYLCQYTFQVHLNCCFKINRINWICAATQIMTEHLYHIVHELAFLPCTLIVRNRGGHYLWSVVNNSPKHKTHISDSQWSSHTLDPPYQEKVRFSFLFFFCPKSLSSTFDSLLSSLESRHNRKWDWFFYLAGSLKLFPEG